MAKVSADQRAKQIDAKWNIPRLATAQYESSYRAFINFMQAVASNVTLALFALFSCLCLGVALFCLLVCGLPTAWVVLAGCLILLFIGLLFAFDSIAIWIPFSRLKQRETHGTARRATQQDLSGRGLLLRKGEVPDKPMINVAQFGAFHHLAFDLDQFSGHNIYFGPPRSGKSDSFFIPQIRQFPKFGSVLALAIKGEIFKYTVSYMAENYRIDLNSPENSDRIPLLSECRNNATLAGELCALIVSLDPTKRGGGNDTSAFFATAATHLGKSLILELANQVKNPTPAHIVEFIGTHPRDVEVIGPQGKPVKVDLLDIALSNSTSEVVRNNWSIFRRYDSKLQGGIIATLVTMLDQFTLPNVQVVFSAPTELDRRRGVKTVDFRKLRKKGTAIYVCIDEGKDKELANVISTIFGYANSVLKRSADTMAHECPCLMALDEASNIYLNFLRGGVGVGRGLGIFYMLGLQGYEFLEDLYGASGAAAIFSAINNKFILPGSVGKTAELFSKIVGQTTALSRTSVDSNTDSHDAERASETGRPLVDVSALREMLKHTQGLAVITDCPAVFFAFPPRGTEVDPHAVQPPHYNFEMPPSLADSTPAPPDPAEYLREQYERQRAEARAREEEQQQQHEHAAEPPAPEEPAPAAETAHAGGDAPHVEETAEEEVVAHEY